MFFLLPMTKTMVIHPKECGPHLRQTIENKLHREVQGTMGVNFCHIVAVKNIDKIGKGKIQDETGNACFKIKYTAFVFRPIKNQVVDATVKDITSDGIFCKIGPAEIFIVKDSIPDDFSFEESTKTFSSHNGYCIREEDILRVKIEGIRPEGIGMFATATIKDDFLGAIGMDGKLI